MANTDLLEHDPFADLIPQAGSDARQPIGSPSTPQRAQLQVTAGSNDDPFADLIPQQPTIAPTGEEKKSGLFNNIAAGLNEGVYGTLGAPVDAMTWLYNAAAAQARAISGAPVRNIEKPIGGSAWMGTAVNRATYAVLNPLGYDGVNDPANVEPKGPLERAARAAGQGVGSALTPETIVGALGRAGMLTPGAMQAFAPVFGDATSGAWTARNMAIGGAGGVGAEQASGAAEEAGAGPWGQMAAGLAGGLAGGIGGDLASSGAGAAARGVGRAGQAGVDYFAPTQASQERVAGRMLRKAASDPDAVAAMDTSAVDILPGSAPTTFQATGDMGVGGLERAVATRSPEAFQQRRADQNAARLDALDALAPDGAPDALPRTLRGDVAAADAVAAQDIDLATARATQETRALGGDLPPEASGAVMRQRVLDADSIARERERGLWQAVDPDGTLTIPTGETIGMARQIVEEMPRLAQPMSGSEGAIFDAVRALDGQPLPFRELHALRSRVSEAMRDELKTNGRTATYARLSRLRGGIERDLDGSVLARAEDGASPASGVSLEDTWGSPASSPAADDGWPGPAPEALRASGRDAAPSPPDAVMREAADIATGRRAPYRVPSFLRWIAARGGVQPDANVEAVLDAADRRHGGILSLGGRSADEWGEAIAEHAGMRQRPDQNQVLDWISEAANGREPDWWRTLHANPDREEAARMAREVQRVAADEGIQLRSRRAALDLIEQEAALYGGNRVVQRAPAPAPEPIRPATFDDAAQERLRAASDATRERARTFAPLKDITRTRGTANDFVTPDAVVPQRIFVPGAKGQATVKAYLDAVGDEGRAPLHDYAVASLRRVAEKPDGSLDPAKVAAWRTKHQDALRALPDTDKALASAADASAAVDTLAATRRQAADMRQAGIVGRIMGLEEPQDVVRTVGSIFGKQDAVAQMKRLAEATAGRDEARSGLRNAIAEHINRQFISNTEAATSGSGTIKSDSFQTFIRKNEQALSLVFNGAEVANLKRIAADLQRANRSVTAVRIPGQSNTAQDLAALGKGERSTWDIMLSAVGGTWAGGPFAGIAAAMGAKAINAARRAGLQKVDDLVRDALLDPALAKALMQKTASGKGTQTLTRRLLHNALKGWDDGPLDDGPGGGSPPSGGSNGGGNGSRGVRSPLEVFNPTRRSDLLPREGGADLAAGASGAAALREHGQVVSGVVAPSLRQGLSRDADAGVGSGALNTPETILSGSGKPMPTKRAAGYRLRALKLDPNDYDLRPVDGGFVAVRKTASTDAATAPASSPSKAAEDAKPRSARPIFDDVRSRLAAAGVPDKELDANAAVMEAYYRTRAKRLGVDADTLYRDQVPDIRNGAASRDLNDMKPQEIVDRLVQSRVSVPAENGSVGRLFVDPHAKTWDLFHGTTALNDFKRFDPLSDEAQLGTSLQGAEKGVVFLTPNPEEAGRYASFSDPQGEAGARIFRVAVSPGKSAVFDIPELLRRGDARFATALKEAWTRHDLGANGRDLNKELQAAKTMLARTDMDRPAVEHTLGATHAAIDLARKDGLDTVVVRGLNESKGGDQVIVINPDRVFSRYSGQKLYQADAGGNGHGTSLDDLLGSKLDDLDATFGGGNGKASMSPRERMRALLAEQQAARPKPVHVDPDAKSWTLYHGTGAPQDFTRFETGKNAIYAKAGNEEAEAVFFTPSPESANDYSGRNSGGTYASGDLRPRVIPVEVTPGKTRVFDLRQLFRDKNFVNRARQIYAREGRPEDFDQRLDDYLRRSGGRGDVDAPYGLGGIATAISEAKAMGLDTLVVRGVAETNGSDQIIVLNPGRVKSAYTGDTMYQSAFDKGGRSIPASINADVTLRPVKIDNPTPISTHDEARARVALGRTSNASGTDVEITRSSVKKWYSKGANETKRALAPHLIEAFENSVTYHDGADGYSYAIGLMRLDGKDVAVRFSINGKARHEGRLHQIEGLELAPISGPAPKNEAGHQRARGPARKINVADAVSAFNRMQPGDFPLFQNARGAATLGDGRAVIELFQARDASTFMHEAAHVFLRDLVQDVAKVPAIKGDLDAVLKWFGTDDATKITREHHEQFARGFEQYLRDGKAPSAGLKRAFEQFKEWLTGIYRSLTELGQPIPENIRGVYDRLLSDGGAGEAELVLSGSGKAMPSKGAAINRLRAMGRDPKDFDLQPVEGGFVAVSKQEAAQQPASGPFGPVHEQFLHDARGAVARLMADQDGEAVAALHHPDVGDIDLVWGKAPSQGQEGYGLAKIAAKHPEVLGDLQGFLGRLSVDPERSGANRVRLRDKTGEAVVSLNWFGQEKRWLLTAYEKENAGGSARMDTAALKVGDDTARPGTGTTNVAPPAARQKAGPDSSR